MAMENVSKLAMYYLDMGDYDLSIHIIELFSQFSDKNLPDLPSEFYTKLEKVLAEANDYKAIDRIYYTLSHLAYSEAAASRKSLTIILDNPEKFEEKKAEIKTLFTHKLFSSEGEIISEDNIDKVSKILGTSNKSLISAKEIFGYIRSARKKEPGMDYFSLDSYLSEDLLIVCGYEGFKETIQKLTQNITEADIGERNRRIIYYIIENSNILFDSEDDFEFVNRACDKLGNDVLLFLDVYAQGLREESFKESFREELLENFARFQVCLTNTSIGRLNDYIETRNSEIGVLVIEKVKDPEIALRITLDISCYKDFDDPIKIDILIRAINEGVSVEELTDLLKSLRWLPESQIQPEDSAKVLKDKREASLKKFKEGFVKLAEDVGEMDHLSDEYAKIRQIYDDIVRDLGIKTKGFKMPIEFLRKLVVLRREDPDIYAIPELVSFLTEKVLETGTAYTIGDIFYSQIGELKDNTGNKRRQETYSPEELSEIMEFNIEASIATWETALEYQKEKTESIVFIVANERTGPADLAAEYLPTTFKNERNILQQMKNEEIKRWVRANRSRISDAYALFIETGLVDEGLSQEILDVFGVTDEKIVPVYGLKVPSTDGAHAEPRGYDEFIAFLEVVSLVGGRTLVMDESTREAPRALESIYNALNKRQDELGGVSLKPFGKIENVTTDNGTTFGPLDPEISHMEVALIDPWSGREKSVTDDTEGFVPKIANTAGFVDIITPSDPALSQYEGVSTIQNLWKAMIAGEVARRMES